MSLRRLLTNRTLYRYLVLGFVVVSGVWLVAAGFERGLRYFTGEAAGPINYTQHPTALATLVPNLQKRHQAWGEGHHYRTNKNGVRDDEALCSHANLLIFGDSNVFAQFLPFEETLGQQLETLFNGEICTVNFGVPGYGPDQSLLRMLYEVDRLALNPEVIVFHLFADNDYGDLFRNFLFTVDEAGKLQKANRDETDYKLRTLERLQAQYVLVRRFRDLLVRAGFDQMGVGEYAPDRAGYALQRPFDSAAETTRYIERFEKVTANEYEKYKNGQYTTWLGDVYDYYIALNPGSEAAYEARQLLTGIFRQARKKSEALNACFVVLVQPSEIDFGDSAPISYQDLGEFSRSFRRDYRRRNLADIAKAAAIAAEVDYIDLFELYENSAVEPYTSYRYDKGDSHWNSAGVRIAAEALSRFVAENQCLNRVLE